MGRFDWQAWQPVDRAVLCFVRRDDEVLLIHKKRGLGAGKINGPGGRLEPGETPVQAAVRETTEEVGVVPGDLSEQGDLSFVFVDGYSLRVTVFVAASFQGTPVETEEALPFWCPVDAVPFDSMWADDRLWLPSVLQGKRVSGRFFFDDDRMLTQDLDID